MTQPDPTPALPTPVLRTIPREAHGISRRQMSQSALRVLYRLREAGYGAFLVGGAVRDLLVGGAPKDFDVATDATPEQVKALFRNCRLIGRRFRLAHVVYGHEIIEVATFRASSANDDDDRQTDDGGRLLRTFDPLRASLRTWLAVIARSTALDALRRRPAREVKVAEDWLLQFPAAEEAPAAVEAAPAEEPMAEGAAVVPVVKAPKAEKKAKAEKQAKAEKKAKPEKSAKAEKKAKAEKPAEPKAELKPMVADKTPDWNAPVYW